MIITRMRLKNFRQHQSLEIEFGPGMVLIKGANESGKSSIVEAILYFFLGLRAVEQPLSEMVTWGQSESSLRVEMDFSHAGAEYSGYRQKSGAELRGPGVTASGQSEVTKFLEGLWGTQGPAAGNLMFAAQGDLRGILSQGHGPSIELIEKLADVSLLDSIIDKIQTRLPNGNVKPLTEMLQTESGVAQPVEPDLQEVRRLLEEAKGMGAAVEAEVGVQQAALERARQQANTAAHFEERAKVTQAAATKAQDLLDQAHQRLQQFNNTRPTAALNAAELRAKQRAQEIDLVTRRARKQFSCLNNAGLSHWDGTVDSLKEKIGKNNWAKEQFETTATTLAQHIGYLKGTVIKDGECSFCGKSLDGVPEVAERNLKTHNDLHLAQQQLDELKSSARALVEEQAELLAIYDHHNADEAITQGYGDYIQLESSERVPFRWKWIGPAEIGEEPDTTNYTFLIHSAEREQAAVERWGVQSAMAAQEITTLMESLSAAQKLAQESYVPIGQYAAACATVTQLGEAVRNLSATVQKHAERARSAQAMILEAEVEFRVATESYNKSLVRRAELATTISKMTLNNTVIKKLREARPEVARRLWGLVLHSVSHYVSRIRDTPSNITRGDSGFLVDGHSADSYSGSAKDSLGLAIRLALIWTFLPNMRFMLLDEPAAASDDSRETHMIGTVASAGFDQVIMISHSDLADSFASKIIQL